MSLQNFTFPDKGFGPDDASKASQFINDLTAEVGVVSVANTLRTVLKSRQRQNILMKSAREFLKREQGK